MSNIRNWSKTPASNNSAPPDGAPEGQAPSTVNDIMRQQMADHRTQWEDAEWFDWGHTLVRQGNGSFLVSLTATQVYTAGRRLKLYDTTTIYAEVLASAPSGANTLVSISGSNLSTSLTSGAVGTLNPQFNSFPAGATIERPTVTSPTITSPIIGGSISGSVMASQAQMEAGSETGFIVSPGRAHFHPGIAKAGCRVVFTGGVPAINQSYNVSTVTDVSQGVVRLTLGVTFTSTDFMWPVVTSATAGRVIGLSIGSTTQVVVEVFTTAGAAIDTDFVMAVFGKLQT